MNEYQTGVAYRAQDANQPPPLSTIMSGLIIITALITAMIVVIVALLNGHNGIITSSYLAMASGMVGAGLGYKVGVNKVNKIV